MSKSKSEANSTEVMTVRLPSQIKERLERLAKARSRSKSWLTVEAITRYLEFDEWQTQEICQALEEAERGEFASPEEVQRVFSRWIR
jgi:predicted transcriptional regulator